jgi:hypothetical protein
MMRRCLPERRGSGLAVGLAAVSLILAGCVNLPSAGTLHKVNRLRNSDLGNQLVITPRGPGPQWQPKDIVSGFLVASGADPSDLGIARAYLTRGYAKAWHPSSAPHVIDTDSKVVVTGGLSSAQVTVTSQHLEALVAAGANEAGRLQVSPRPAPYVFTFELLQVNGKWRIDSVIVNGKTSDSILLLTDSDFERDYLPRELYYLARGTPRTQTLVPYPVYIPAQPGQLGGVQQLVDAVRTLPPTRSNWLYQAIATAFPPGTKLTAQVQGSNAVVSLGGKAARSNATRLREMEAQLVWTLTYAPDSAGGTGINSVELQIRGRSTPNLLPLQFSSWVPQGPPGPLYFQPFDQAGRPHLEAFVPRDNFAAAARTHRLAGGERSPVLLASGLGGGPFTTVAISPAQADGVNYFAGCRGKTAYVAPLVIDPDLESGDLPGNCTSLSWDNQGDVWAVAGSDVYVLNATMQVIPVSIPAQQIAGSDSFVSLKVAPDGIRVAMIVRGKNGASVYVSAITKNAKNTSVVYLAQGGPVLTAGPDLLNPIALTWWDSNHLLVLDRLHGVSQLYEVPLNGGESTKVVTPRNALSVSANGSLIVVDTPASEGHSQPTVLASRGLYGAWVQVNAGSTPTYAG